MGVYRMRLRNSFSGGSPSSPAGHQASVWIGGGVYRLRHPCPSLRTNEKRRPFDSPEQEATLSIARTADRFGICYARLFREFGLTSSQYNVLSSRFAHFEE